jgi:hypothetical protein
VLGNSLGLNVVQVEVEAHAVRSLDFLDPGIQKSPILDIQKSPQLDKVLQSDLPKLAITDLHVQKSQWKDAHADPVIAPFVLTTHQQAPLATVAAFRAYQASLSR